MRDPVRGEFRVTDRYFAHPGSTSFREMLTGVVTGPGVAPTPGEHLTDTAGRWVGHDVLPVTVDRGDPSHFVILWDEVPKPDWRAEARQQAANAAAQLSSGAAPPPGPPVIIDAGMQVIDFTAGHLSAGDAERLCAYGEPASAVLTAVTDVPVPRAALPGPTASLCDLTLEVTRADGRTYRARTRLGFRDARRRAAFTAPGLRLPVRVDPADQARVAVDVGAFDASHPGG
jgi:hypothetical protein